MKTQIKRFSKSTLAVVLTLCMLVSCMTVGIIATDAAYDNSASVGATTKVYFRNNDNWSNVYILTSSSINASVDNEGCKGDIWGSGLKAATAMTLVPGETKVYEADITLTDNKVVFVSNKSTQDGYLSGCGNCVARFDYAAGKIVNAWDSSDSSNKIDDRNSTKYWKSNLEDYTPPVASTTRVYVKTGLKNKSNVTMTHAYIWSNNSDIWDTGAWPGQAMSGWTTAGSYKYKDFTTYNYNKFKIILTNGASSSTKQTDNSEDYATGKTWVFDSVDSTDPNGKAIGTEGYPVAIGTVSNGTITSDKSVAKSGDTVTLTLSPSSGFTVTAPTVTKAGGGTVSVSGTGTSRTFTMPSDAVTVTATFPADATPTINTFTIGGAASKTLNIGETATLASTISNSTGTVTYTSSDSTVASITGTTVKALKPGSATITASLTGATSKTVSVSVSTPTVSYSYSNSKILVGRPSVSPTVSVSNKNSGSTVTYAYSLANTTYATINASTGVITAKTTTTNTGQNASVTATVTYNGVSYTTSAKTTTYTVYAYHLLGLGKGWSNTSTNMFTYDTTRNVWTVSVSELTAKTYSGDTDGFKVRCSDSSATWYGHQSGDTMTRQYADNTAWSFTSPGSNFGLNADAAGTYVFDLAINSSGTATSITAHYPQKVNYDKNGKTTTAFPTTPAYVTYNTAIGSAPSTTPASAGYNFKGWYTTASGSTTYNFATTKVTAETTIYAQWNTLPALSAPAIKYNSSASSPVSIDAAQGSNARITWSAISGAGSYEVYKGSTKVTTVTTAYYDIERSYANNGTYTVKAIPSDTSANVESAASNGIQFTFNKVKLTAPTVTTDKAVDAYIKGDAVTFTLSGTTGTIGTAFRYQRTGENNTTFTNFATATSTTSTVSSLTAGSKTFKFKAVSLLSNYYSDSDEVSVTLTVALPKTTLYVKDTITSFTHAYIYQGTNNLGAWPGSAFTSWNDGVKVNGYYKLEFEVDWVSFFVILNDGKVTGASQTQNMKAEDAALIGGTYKIDSAGSGSAVTLTPGAPLPQLTAPSITMNGGTSAVSVNAAKNSKVTLAWSSVAGAGSYQVYKGDSLVGTVTATSYEIERGYSYSGNYKVIAVPSDDTVNANSPDSNKIQLTVNKVALAQPTISLNKSAVNNTDTGVTVTVTNYAALSAACTFTLTGATVSGSQSNISNAGVFSITGYNSSAYNGANNNITVTAEITSSNTDYYSIASATSAQATLKVYKPDFALCGGVSKVTATGITTPSLDNWNNKSEFVIENTTQTPGVYSLVFTTTSEAYLGLRNTNYRYSVKVDGISYNTNGNDYEIPSTGKSGMELITASDGSMKFAAGKTYTITVNQTNNTVSVSTDSWNVTTVARYKDYDLATGAYKAVATGTTGGTVSPASASVKKGQSTTLTATAATGYTFTGWFTNEECTGTAVSTAASYSPTPTADTNYYALFTKNEPAKVNITVANVTGATISATWNGTSKTNGQTLSNVPVGASVSVTVTPADDKYVVSTTPALTNGKFTVTSTTTNITVTLGNKFKITSNTNKSSWGTVATTPEYAKPGDTVTITYSASTGILKTLTAYDTTNSSTVKVWKRDSNGDMKVDSTVSSSNRATTLNLTGITGSVYSFINKAGNALGAIESSTDLGADDALTFTMPNGAVTVTATYEEYVGTSEYYYNYYSGSGKGNSSQLSEGKVNGNTYGYYNVTDRSESDQLFTISHRTVETGTRYVYFTCPGDWDNLHVYFYNGVSWNWPGDTMTAYDNNGNYRYEIPSGAKGVIFNNGNGSYQTVNIDLTNTRGAYYISSGEKTTSASVESWSEVPTDAGLNDYDETEYFSTQNDQDIYPGTYQAYTDAGLFNDHGIGSTRVAKPKGNNFDTNKNDYYILVFYPGVTYSIDGSEFTPTGNPLVYWSPTLPGQTETVSSTVKVYAKDGTIRRDGDQPERNNATYSTFEKHANTFIYGDSGYATLIGTRSTHDEKTSEGDGFNGFTYDFIQKFEKGQTLYIKTVLSDDSFMNNFYLYAYSINGKTYQLHTQAESETGTVTEAFTVPEDWEDNYVEITPIYFHKTTTNSDSVEENRPNDYITFYVEGYDETVMNAGWGNTPFVYPFYQDSDFNYVTNVNNPFGGYPGQPMVFYQGNYYTQLPKEYHAIPESGGDAVYCTLKGVTLGNGYWDDIHILTGEVSSHFQTYDYDDLYKIYNEYPDQADHIICSFKYRTKKNNDEPGNNPTYSNYNSTNGNGWEVLTDYYGRPVDVFGNILTGSAKTLAESIMANPALADSSAVVHVISQDYKPNSAGDFGTEWAIYNPSGTKIVATSGGKTTIVPSALAITDVTHFANYDTKTRAFESIYTALKNSSNNVVNQPAVITYEKSIYGGSDKADRCDARWSYSTKGADISASVRIEYTDDGKTWQTDAFNSGTGTGATTNTKAYFIGKATEATDTPTDTTGINGKNTTTLAGQTGEGYYIFNAENYGQYEFVGWYLLRDNYQNISTRSSYASSATEFASHAEQAKSGDIFVARFRKTATGTFDIYHEIHPQTTGYGNVYVQAVVKDSSGTTQATIGNLTTDTTVRIPNTYIRSGEGYKVIATFKAVPNPTSSFDDFYATIQSLLADYNGYGFISGTPVIDTTNNTATVTYDVDSLFSVASGSPVQTVTSVTHYSKFSLRDDLTYSLQYQFRTRYYGNKLYKYTNETFTPEELRSYFLDQIQDPSVDTISLDKQFVQSKAPFESNFREDLTWVVNDVEITENVGYLVATQVPVTWANAMVYDFDNSGSMQTQRMAAPIEKLFDKTVTTKPENAATAAEKVANWDNTCVDDNLYRPLRTTYVDSTDGNTKPLYIDHWEAYQLDSFTYFTQNGNPKMKDDGINLDIDTGKSVLVCMSYSSKFNYVGYEDYAIVPVYSKEYVNRQEESDTRTDSSATLLTITRNHWNDTVSGSADSGSYGSANTNYDRLYVDFMLNYNYSKNGQNVMLSSTGDNVKVGFIIKSYTMTYSEGVGTKSYSGNAQIVMVNKSEIDNKNRLEYCYGFKNSQNNSRYGLFFEFTPFIIDTTQTGEGPLIKLPSSAGGGEYNLLYDDAKPLDGVTFYRVGNYDVDWTN